MIVRKVFRFRMEPSAAQREAMARMAGARRFVWNWALAQSRAHFAETGKGLSAAELSRRFTALKQRPETAWLQDVDSQAMQQSLADLQTRLSEFLREAGALSAFQEPQARSGAFPHTATGGCRGWSGVCAEGWLCRHPPISAG